MHRAISKYPSILALALFLGGQALYVATAGSGESVEKSSQMTSTEAKESIFDKIWNLPKLYRDDHNPFIEEFDLIGRFQEDYFNVDSDKGNSHYWEIRRLRFGADAFLADRHLELKAEVDTNLHSYRTDSIFYNRFTNLWARVHVNDAFNVRFGKMEPHFGYDREVSDTYQKFFERSVFDDQVIGGNDYIPGVEVSGKVGHLGYLAAAYSTTVNNRELGHFDGGEAWQAEVNYDFAKPLNADKALWVLDYLHADGKNANTNVFTNYRNALATYFDYEKQKFSLVTQVAYGNQVKEKGDVYSLLLMPGYKITDQLELIGRYTLAVASESNGIVTGNRQQKTIGSFTGDTYNAGYVGLDYYIYGHKLKLMFGEEYAHLSGGTGPNANYSGWTTWAGLRLFF